MNQVRIIGGYWKRRIIKFSNDNSTLRPTLDRIRETAFNWLTPYINNTHCLDLFTGSGILGIEAVSRGAKHATLIDSDAGAIADIKKNIDRLTQSEKSPFLLCHSDTLQWLKNNKRNQQFDIVFLDPPFSHDLYNECLELLVSESWIHPESLLYIECDARSAPAPANWVCLKSKSTKQVHFGLYSQSNHQ